MTDEVKVNETFFSKFDLGSEYLKSSDLLIDGVFKAFSLTIDEFFPSGSLVGGDKKRIDKPVISFKEAKKRMILNSTSQQVLHLVSGTADGTKTPGTKVMIEAREVEAFGERCLGLRLMPAAKMVIPRGLKKRLGNKPVWEGQPIPEEKPA